MEKKINNNQISPELLNIDCYAPIIREIWSIIEQLIQEKDINKTNNWVNCIKSINNYVIVLLWETLRKEKIDWNDIRMIWDLLKEQARTIKWYMSGPILQIYSNFIDIYKDKINDIDFDIFSIENLRDKDINFILLTLRYNAIWIIESLYQRWDELTWEEMSFFWTEILNISLKIDFLNHYIPLKKYLEKK